MSNQTYAATIAVATDLVEVETLDEGFNNEYLRGMVNLIADLFGTADMDTSTRMDEILQDMRDYKEGEILGRKSEIASEVTHALRKLYAVCDGDEAEVGEIMHEIHKAARN